MRSRAAQLSLATVALFIGLLLVGQLRSQARPIQLGSLSAQQLSELIETTSTGNVELRDGLAELREQVRTYEEAQALGESALDVTREELRRITAFGGLAPVEGQGIVMRVSGALDHIAVNDLINELRNAGAEAIAVDAVRVTAGSVAVIGADAIEIDGIEIGSSFTINAIGSPEGLLSALERPGGIVAVLEQAVAATISVQQSEAIAIPTTHRDLTPRVAQPLE
ncbi:MAG: DUF881 domain-containing protein [Candidatus Limnocylindria bacterium]